MIHQCPFREERGLHGHALRRVTRVSLFGVGISMFLLFTNEFSGNRSQLPAHPGQIPIRMSNAILDI